MLRARKVILFSLEFQMSQTKLFHCIILFVVTYLLNRNSNTFESIQEQNAFKNSVWEWSITGELHREIKDSPSLKILKPQLDKHMDNLTY